MNEDAAPDGYGLALAHAERQAFRARQRGNAAYERICWDAINALRAIVAMDMEADRLAERAPGGADR